MNQFTPQAHQDIFAKHASRIYSYIEIGGSHPIKRNNTLLLENEGWHGFSIELNEKFKKSWAKSRKNKIYFDNALTFDYASAVAENNLSMRVGYLSCDIEPPCNTFAALQRTLEQGINFDCITFEHDEYQSAGDYNKLATEYLESKGYKVAVYGVYFKNHHFETWFVKNDIEFEKISFDEWKEKMGITE